MARRPHLTVISGGLDGIDELIQEFADAGINFDFVPLSADVSDLAAHCDDLDPNLQRALEYMTPESLAAIEPSEAMQSEVDAMGENPDKDTFVFNTGPYLVDPE